MGKSTTDPVTQLAKKGGSKKGKKGRKIGRSKRSPAHARYNAEGRRASNKIKKVKRHLRRVNAKQPKGGKPDKQAEAALKRLLDN